MQPADARFLKLEDVLLPPPLPALVSILFALGLLWIGRKIAARLRPSAPEPVDVAAGFILAAGCVAAAVHALALLQFLRFYLLRAVGIPILAAGIVEARNLWRAREGWKAWRPQVKSCPPLVRVALVISAFTLLGIALASLAPVFDEDSLTYHLAVPLEWLRHGGTFATPDWMSSRLVGLGENLNLLGLALGTDGLGAAMQFSGILAALAALMPPSMALAERAFVLLLVTATPVLTFLAPSQKPQLLPAAATTVALVLLYRRRPTLDRGTLALVAGCSVFAAACKYSFLISGAVVLAWGFTLSRRARILRPVIGYTAVFFAIFIAPIYCRNLVFFGDPVSPLMEPLRHDPDPAVAGFRAYIRGIGRDSGTNPTGIAAKLLVLTDRANPAGFLGAGVLSFLLVWRSRGVRPLLLAALLAAVALAVFGQWMARFFLEPYLWCGAAAGIAAGATRPRKTLLAALAVQCVYTAALAWFYAAALFPGALTPGLRDRVMTRSVVGYPESRWMDRTLPADARILPESYANVLMPRPFAAFDRAQMLAASPLPISRRRELLVDQLRRGGISMLILDSGKDPLPLAPIVPFLNPGAVSATVIPTAVLNPLKTGAPRRIYAFALRVPAVSSGTNP
jgi:hypothetical protein